MKICNQLLNNTEDEKAVNTNICHDMVEHEKKAHYISKKQDKRNTQ